MNKLIRNLGSIEQNPTNQHHEVNIASDADNQPSQSLPMNLPRRDLLDRIEDFNEICVPLYNLLTTGGFQAAKVILKKRKELVRFSITESYETPLHIAVFLGEAYMFVKYLMTLMTKEDLELTNGNGETFLCLAARVGNVEIAKVLVEKNKGLIDILDSQGRIPLQVAALFGRHDMVKYLYDNSQKMIRDFWTHQDRSWLLEKCVEADIFGIAFQMVTVYPKLAENGSLLRVLARKPYAFRGIKPPIITIINSMYVEFGMRPFEYPDKDPDALKLLRIIMIEIMKLSKVEILDIIRGPPDDTKEDEKKTPFEEETQEAIQPLPIVSENIAKMPAKTFSPFERPPDEMGTSLKEAKQKYSSGVLFLAAEMGNAEFLFEVFRRYPYLALEVNDDNHSVFHVAVIHRHESIYKLLHEKKHIRDSIITLEDKNGNNMLHLVGETTNGNRIPKATSMGLQTNLEMQLFKEIERILPGHLCKKKNKAGLTPYQLFIKNHNDIFSTEEKLMKEMANQLMVVAALVATISFATVFTFPGGYNQDTGIPIFFRKNLSKVFIICDSLSFLFSTTSIVMVLYVIMSYPDADAILISKATPIKASLFLVFYSIVTITITFVISLFLLYQSHSRWVPILISTFALMSYFVVAFINNHGRFDEILKPTRY